MEREGERSIEQSLANQMMVADLCTDTTCETPCPAHPDRHGTAVRWFLCHWRPLGLCFAQNAFEKTYREQKQGKTSMVFFSCAGGK